MRGVKHEFGMLITHGGRLTPTLERPNNRGRLEQVLGNRGKSEEAGSGLDGPTGLGSRSSARRRPATQPERVLSSAMCVHLPGAAF